MIKFPEGTRVIAEVPGIIDFDGDVVLDPSTYIMPRDFDKFKVRLAPVEIKRGSAYRDADGNFYLGLDNGLVTDGYLRSYGPNQDYRIPSGLVEVSA